MRACLRGSRVFMLTVYICVCHICFRQSIFSQAVGGRVLMGARLSRKLPESIRKRDSPSRCIEGGGLPMTSFTLAHCLFDPVAAPLPVIPHSAVSVLCVCALSVCECLCFVGLESFFHTCHGSPPKLYNLEALIPPTQPLPALPLFQTTLAPTDRALCVTLTCLFLQGLLTQPQDHLE